MSNEPRPLNFYRLRGILVPVASDLHGGLNTVGRNPTNDVVIHEASVSSFHAEITVDENGVWLRDLQSTNGTFVDDEPTVEKEIRSGQVVQFGTVPFRLEVENPVRIVVPRPVQPAPEATPAALPDGAVACSKDPTSPATHRCTKCGRGFHYDHLRVLRLSGEATPMLFCPECSARVEPIPGVDPSRVRRPNILKRLSQTIQLGFRRAK